MRHNWRSVFAVAAASGNAAIASPDGRDPRASYMSVDRRVAEATAVGHHVSVRRASEQDAVRLGRWTTCLLFVGILLGGLAFAGYAAGLWASDIALRVVVAFAIVWLVIVTVETVRATRRSDA
jgi:hypothetical protein